MSTLTDSLVACRPNGKPGDGSGGGIIGDVGSSISLIRDSTDCAEATRILGGTASWKTGEGELG